MDELNYDTDDGTHSDVDYLNENSDDDLGMMQNQSDYYDGDDIPPQLLSGQSCDKNKQNDGLNITTEGIDASIAINLTSDISASLRLCDFCNKYYKHEMFMLSQVGDMYQCQHCFFYMNYHNKELCDASIFGPSIVEYILNCHETHNSTICQRLSDSGGCYLCEYKLGFPLDGVKNAHLLGLNNQFNESDESDESDCDIDDLKYDNDNGYIHSITL